MQSLLLQVVKEESAEARKLTEQQQREQIAAAKAGGVTFLKLKPEDKDLMVAESAKVYKKWGPQIGQEYMEKVMKILQE